MCPPMDVNNSVLFVRFISLSACHSRAHHMQDLLWFIPSIRGTSKTFLGVRLPPLYTQPRGRRGSFKVLFTAGMAPTAGPGGAYKNILKNPTAERIKKFPKKIKKFI